MTEILQSGAIHLGRLSSWRILISFPGSWSLFGTGNKIAEVELEIYKIIDNSYIWVRRQWKSRGGPGSVLLNRARPFVSSHLNYEQARLWVTRASGEAIRRGEVWWGGIKKVTFSSGVFAAQLRARDYATRACAPMCACSQTGSNSNVLPSYWIHRRWSWNTI